MKYTFINYKNEIIHTAETNNPDQVEKNLIAEGYQVGGYQIAQRANIKTKSIAYAFPTSQLATENDRAKTGCYYIETGLINVEGSGQANYSPDYQVGFFEAVDQDLLDSFDEAEGEPCKHSLKYNASFYSL